MQVYRESFELAESVATYFGAGFDAGEPAVAVATGAHRPLIVERLGAHGWDAGELEAGGMLVVRDAETTLEAISEDGMPSPIRFSAVVGALIDRAAAGEPTRRVRVFGEMVDVLCRRDERAAADALEGLWNRLAAVRNFSLLCGYRVDLFDRDAQTSLLPQVYRAHSHVLPAPDAERLEAAVATALSQVLGRSDAEKVYARATRHGDEKQVPSAQRALLWVSAHMPQTAQRVLAAARTHYLTYEPA